MERSPRVRIAILGATSHIAKGLIESFCKSDGSYMLDLFTRDLRPVEVFLEQIDADISKFTLHDGYQSFLKGNYDGIINCVGVGTVNKLENDYTRYFTVTEQFDNLSIEYLKGNHDALYISISSGVVYGRAEGQPFNEHTLNCVDVNNVKPTDYYTIARLNAEAKHRAFSKLNIIDLRVFSYFSEYAELSDPYLMNDVASAILDRRVLTTGGGDIVRDYIHPEDVFGVVVSCLSKKQLNRSLDLVSRAPITKFQILDTLNKYYQLEYEIDNQIQGAVGATGVKNAYYSTNQNVVDIGYEMKYRSIDAITDAMEKLVEFQR